MNVQSKLSDSSGRESIKKSSTVFQPFDLTRVEARNGMELIAAGWRPESGSK